MKLIFTILSILMLFNKTIVLASEIETKPNNAFEAFMSNGLFTGLNPNINLREYSDNKPILRAEFISILNNLYKLEKAENIRFVDVMPGNWFYDDVRKAIGNGYADGYADAIFSPLNQITREEGIVMCARLLGITSDEDSETPFSDNDQISRWSKKYISAMYERGYLKTFGDSSLYPQKILQWDETLSLFMDMHSSQDNIQKDEVTVETRSIKAPDIGYNYQRVFADDEHFLEYEENVEEEFAGYRYSQNPVEYETNIDYDSSASVYEDFTIEDEAIDEISKVSLTDDEDTLTAVENNTPMDISQTSDWNYKLEEAGYEPGTTVTHLGKVWIQSKSDILLHGEPGEESTWIEIGIDENYSPEQWDPIRQNARGYLPNTKVTYNGEIYVQNYSSRITSGIPGIDKNWRKLEKSENNFQ